MDALGSSWPVFIGLTVMIFGGAAFLTGQALARTWQPQLLLLPYSLLLGCGDRFLVYALFGGELLSVAGYLVDSLVLLAIAALAYQLTRAHKMVSQYPWLYERRGLFGWREKGGGA